MKRLPPTMRGKQQLTPKQQSRLTMVQSQHYHLRKTEKQKHPIETTGRQTEEKCISTLVQCQTSTTSATVRLDSSA